MATLVAGEQLSQLVLSMGGKLAPARAELFASVLDDELARGDITNGRRIRHFLAQVMLETGGLRGLVESTNYTNPQRLDQLFKNVQGVEHARRLIEQGPEAIGNTIYANKNGNGGVTSGDGFRYRGRGLLQVTGRANYRALGQLIGMPLEDDPEQLGQPQPATQAAVSFWKMRDINRAADADDVGSVTFLVNGPAQLHLKERGDWLAAAARIWAD